MPGVELRIDTKEMQKTLNKLSAFPKEMNKATSSAINRTLTFTNKKMKQEVRKEYAIKSGDIQSTINLRKATPSKLTGIIISSGNRLALSKFSKIGKWKKGKPVKVKVKKTGAKKVNTDPKAFVANLNGNNHIVKRVGSKRFPIQVLKTVSVPQMISNEKITKKVTIEAQKKLQERVEHEINYRMGKIIKSGG